MSAEYSVDEVRKWIGVAKDQEKLFAGMKGAHEPWTKLAHMLRACAERIEADERAVDAMRALLVKSLMAYRCIRTVDEDGEPLPLVDALSPGEGGTIQPGTEEIEYLAEYLAYELQGPPAQVAQACENCKGRREVFNDVHVRMMTCPQCRGSGKAPTTESVAQGEVSAHYRFTIKSKVCPRCDGRGRTTAHAVPCSQCGGTGELS